MSLTFLINHNFVDLPIKDLIYPWLLDKQQGQHGWLSLCSDFQADFIKGKRVLSRLFEYQIYDQMTDELFRCL